MVSAVRTERALVRATSKQERIEEGLSGEKARKSVTLCSFASLWAEKNAAAQPAVETADSHSLVGERRLPGPALGRAVAWGMRASYSARPTWRASQYMLSAVRESIMYPRPKCPWCRL